MKTPLKIEIGKRNAWAIVDADGKPILCSEGAMIGVDEAESLVLHVNAGHKYMVGGNRRRK